MLERLRAEKQERCRGFQLLMGGLLTFCVSHPASSGIFQSDFPVDAQTVNPSIHSGLTENRTIVQDAFPVGPQSVHPLVNINKTRATALYSIRSKEVSIWRKILSSTSLAELPASVDKVQAVQSPVEFPRVTARPSYKYQTNTDAESWSALIVEKQEEVTKVISNNNRLPYTTELSQSTIDTNKNIAEESQYVIERDDYEDNTNLSSARHFTPSVSLQISWDDNLYRESSNETSGWSSVLSPSFKYETGIGAHNFSALYAANIGHYFSSEKDDYLDQKFKLDAFLDMATRHRLMLGAEYKDWHDPRGTDDSASVAQEPDEWHATTVDGTYSFGAKGSQGRVDMYAGHTLRRYDNNSQDTRDRDITNYSAILNTRWAKINFLAGTELSNIDYINEDPATVIASGSLDSQESSLFAGATWVATGKTSGSVKIGSLSKDFDSSLRKDYSGSGWEVGIKWNPVTHSTWELSTYQNTREQTTGNDDYVKVTDYKLSWQHEWLRQYKSNFSLGVGEDVFNRSNRTDERFLFSAALYKRFNRIFKGGLSYQYSERDSTDNTSDYERNLIMLTITSDF